MTIAKLVLFSIATVGLSVLSWLQRPMPRTLSFIALTLGTLAVVSRVLEFASLLDR